MNKDSKNTRFTYVNVVGTLALFIALGGVSWAAASAPRNSVSSKAIKKNAVTAAKIKKNSIVSSKVKNGALTGADFKAESLTGAQINEGSLGTVPSAVSAAGSSNVISIFKKAPAHFGSEGSFGAARAAAPIVPLFTHGQLTFYGKCFVYSGDLTFETLVASSTNFASMYGYSTGSYPYQFGPDTPESSRLVDTDDTGANAIDENYAEGAFVLGADGKGVRFNTQTWGHFGTDTGAPSHTGPNECSWAIAGMSY